MNKRALIGLLILLPSLLFGYAIGGPTVGARQYKFVSSLMYTREARDLSGLRINSNRVLWRLNWGITDFLEIYGMIGGSDINFPSNEPFYITGYNGSWEMAFGGGVRLYYLDWRIAQLPRNFRSFVHLFIFAHSSVDTLIEAGVRNWRVKYRMQELGLSAYWSYNWQRLIFYGGGEWTYISGRVYWEAYTTDYEPLYKSNAYFSDPTFWPRPVLGVDIRLPKNLYLSFELRPWFNKKNTTFTISFSQTGGLREGLKVD